MESTALNPEKAIKLLRKFRNNRHASETLRGTVEKPTLEKTSRGVGIYFIPLALPIFLFAFMAFTAVALLHWIPSFEADTAHITFPVIFKTAQSFVDLKTGVIEGKFFLGALIGIQYALFVVCIFFMLPCLYIILSLIFTFKWPTTVKLKKSFGTPWVIFSLMWFSFIFTLMVDHTFGAFIYDALFPAPPFSTYRPSETPSLIGAFIWWVLLFSSFAWLRRCFEDDGTTPATTSNKRSKKNNEGDFALYLGNTTGELIERSHKAGIAKDQPVTLSEQDAALNIVILGGIGEGKTTAVIHSLLLQLLDQDCGGLIFDVKGSFHQSVSTLAGLTKKEVTMIGVGRQKINLLAGLEPEIAANMMGAIFLMTNGSKEGNRYWITQAASLCRSVFGHLIYFKEHYTLTGLSKFIFDDKFREEIEARLSQLELSDEERHRIKGYQDSLNIFYNSHERMQSDIKATAGSALNYFTNPELAESFCNVSNEPLHIEEVLDGKIFLLDAPTAKFGQASRVIQALIKMRWFHTMELRRINKNWNQDRMIFFMCDEYQNVVTVDPSGNCVNDMNFWDKSRDTKAIGIISAQSITSFYSALGDHDLAKTVLQNFRQKICFKTEDENTLRYLQFVTGEVQVGQTSQTKQQSSGGYRSKTSRGESETLTLVKQQVVDSQLMRLLRPNQALALLNLGQQSMDDVLDLQPIYLD